jgi:hypothetical protein
MAYHMTAYENNILNIMSLMDVDGGLSYLWAGYENDI